MAPDFTVQESLRRTVATLFGSRCHGCGRYNRTVCRGCHKLLQMLGDSGQQHTKYLGVAGPPFAATGCPPTTVDNRGLRLETSNLLTVRSASSYAGPPAHILKCLKYGDAPQLANYFAAGVQRVIGSALQEFALYSNGPPLLLPLPSTPKRLRQRGYNHLQLLLRAAGIPKFYTPQALVAAPGRKTQVGLGRNERRRNAGLVTVRDSSIKRLRGAGVLLFDDVVTSGATLTAAARMILSRVPGCRVVGAVTLFAVEFTEGVAEDSATE